MIIQKKELLESLKACMSGIETGSVTLQGADTFVFHDGKIFTYNDSVSVTIPIKNESLLEEGLEGCVKAEEFFKIISKLPADEIKFLVTENKTWLLKCGKAKVEMNLLDFDFESRLKNLNIGDDWIDLNEDFISAMNVCRMVGNKSQLSGTYFDGKDVLSTDGNQVNLYTLKTKLPKFWVSDSSINELLKLGNLKQMQISGAWVHFKTDSEEIFSVKTLNADSYPYDKLRKIIDSTDLSKSELHANFPKELFSAVDRAVSFSMNVLEHSVIRLTISKDKIEVSSERSSGKYNEKVAWENKIENDFEPFVVYVDAQMIQSISQKTAEFYLVKGPVRNGKSVPRMFFVTESSKHLICTFDFDEE